MTLLSDQLSAVRKSQWEAQLDTMRSFSSRALDNTEQLIALNLKVSRASMEQAAGTFRQILDAREPRDLFAVGAAAQGQWQQLFSYGRDLLGIATGNGLRTWTPEQLAALSPPPQVMEQVAIATSAATTVASEITAAATETGDALAQATLHAATTPQAPVPPVPEVTELEAEKTGAAPSETPQEDGKDEGQAKHEASGLVVEAQQAPEAAQADAPLDADAAIETAIADDVPPGRTTLLVQALNEASPQPASVAHPVVSTVALEARDHVDLPIVLPQDSVPPPAARVRDTKPRASRKK
jgi:hypothetical protein